ncbi:hypothetical protein DL768_002150 [Monosporascus sp. mg162]|nr:hypothetical protein DL768_002150 [Monosporascus sp. mg162]
MLVIARPPGLSRFRAVYSADPRGGAPRLSGVELNRNFDTPRNLAPPEPHQRYDDRDLDPPSLVLVRGPRPPDGPSSSVPDATHEKEFSSWLSAAASEILDIPDKNC